MNSGRLPKVTITLEQTDVDAVSEKRRTLGGRKVPSQSAIIRAALRRGLSLVTPADVDAVGEHASPDVAVA